MVLTTGDLKNSVARLRALLKATRYPHMQAHANGEFSVADLLRILHHALLDYSRHVAAFILDTGYDLYGKTDARFIDQCFRLMRDEFQYFPSVNSTQFLSTQFLERKIQLVGDILDIVVNKHDACVRRRRQEQAVWSKPRELKTPSTHVENHVMPPPATTPTTIDTWSLLAHFREEARERAREEKRAAAQSIEQRRLLDRVNTRNSDTQRRTLEPSPRRTPSPSNQRSSASDATDSNSDTDAKQNNRKKTRDVSTESMNGQHTQAACACGSGDTKAEVQEVIMTLGKQISDLTTAVLTRVSGIESRLANVEQQLQDLKTASASTQPPTRASSPGRRYAPISRTQATFSAASSTASIGPGGTGASAATRSAWPPDPELFNLP